MPATGIHETTEVGQASALEVQHAERRVGPLRVLLDQRVPLAAVRATQFVARLKISRFHDAGS